MNRDSIIGEMAALSDLIATCECDKGNLRRDDLTAAQNGFLWQFLESLEIELSQRRLALERSLQ